MEYCYKRLWAIIAKGKEEGLELDEQTEKYLVEQTMTEGCQAFFVGKIKASLQQQSKMDAKQPMLMALSNTWYNKYPDLKLDFLRS